MLVMLFICATPGPYGDLDQQLVFLQWPTPNTEQLLLRLAANGDR